MKAIVSIFACPLLAVSVALAQPAPTGLPPSFKIVSGTDPAKGLIAFREITYRTVQVQREVAEVVNGMTIKKTVTSNEIVAEERTTQIDASSSRVITPDGKQLPIEEVWKRLKANTVVAVSADGNTPAAAFLRALNAQTLVIIPGPQSDKKKKEV
jgi:hypothetical protein